MPKNAIEKVVWTHQAMKSLIEILDYRYADIPEAREIIRKEILSYSSKSSSQTNSKKMISFLNIEES